MYQRVTESYFRDAFKQAGRGGDFSYEGLGALYEYFNQLEDDLGEQIELDVIAICCEYSEYDLEELKDLYDLEAETLEQATEEMEEQTTVIPVGNETIIIQEF